MCAHNSKQRFPPIYTLLKLIKTNRFRELRRLKNEWDFFSKCIVASHACTIWTHDVVPLLFHHFANENSSVNKRIVEKKNFLIMLKIQLCIHTHTITNHHLYRQKQGLRNSVCVAKMKNEGPSSVDKIFWIDVDTQFLACFHKLRIRFFVIAI